MQIPTVVQKIFTLMYEVFDQPCTHAHVDDPMIRDTTRDGTIHKPPFRPFASSPVVLRDDAFVPCRAVYPDANPLCSALKTSHRAHNLTSYDSIYALH
jgi:hypothetical protein